MRPAILKSAFLVCWLLLWGSMSGCEHVHYMGQAISGHLDLLSKRQAVEDLLHDPQTPHNLRNKLLLTAEILAFAEKELLLPAADQYRTFVQLDRPYVVWNVVAAPELSVEPKTWCYPVAGCTAYRGFFEESEADRLAQRLSGRGYDVMVDGVSAYSTLGWFKDPLLSTFIDRSEPQLAALIFHELAHQQLYVRDDSAFNESFATAVAHEGLRRWYIFRKNPADYRRYIEFYRHAQEMISLICEYRNRLRNLYRSPLPDNIKRRQKTDLFGQLRQEFESRRSLDASLTVFSTWFDGSLNNARLASIATYHDYVPSFRRLLEVNQYDLDRFYQRCRELARCSPENRRKALLKLISPSPSVSAEACF